MAVFDNYSSCEWRIPDQEGETWLSLQLGEVHDPPESPVHLITAWNPFGQPTSLGRNIAHREDMEYDVLAAGGSFLVGSAIALDRAWAEEILVIEGFDDGQAARFAATHGQWIFWRWDSDALHLLEWGWGAVLESVPAEVHTMLRRPCPVIPGSRRTSPCTRGPDEPVEQSIEFDRLRTTLICTAGCDVCESGRRLEPTVDPAAHGSWPVSSRSGTRPVATARGLLAENDP